VHARLSAAKAAAGRVEAQPQQPQSDAAPSGTVVEAQTAAGAEAAAGAAATGESSAAPVDSAIVRWFWPSYVALGACVVLLIVALSLR
jgi:hypothetical protein